MQVINYFCRLLHMTATKQQVAYVMKPQRLVIGMLLAFTSLFSAQVTSAAEIPVVFESTERAVLAAESSGVITQYAVDAGETVAKGSALAKLDTKELQLDLERQKKALNFLYKKIENLKKLAERGLATDEEIGQMRLERDLLRSEIKLLDYKIARSTIKAPYAASVVQRLAQQYEWVQVGQPVVEIINAQKLRVVADVPANLGAQLSKGQSIQVRVPTLDQTVAAKLVQTAPAVDVKSNTLRIYADVQDVPKGLLSGMTGLWITGQAANPANNNSTSTMPSQTTPPQAGTFELVGPPSN